MIFPSVLSFVEMPISYIKEIYDDYLLKKRGEIILKKSNTKGFGKTITRLLERTILSNEANFVEIIFDKNSDTLSIRFSSIEPELSKVLKYQVVTPETKIDAIIENLNTALFTLGCLCAKMKKETGVIHVGNDAHKNIFLYHNSPVLLKAIDDDGFFRIFLKPAT